MKDFCYKPLSGQEYTAEYIKQVIIDENVLFVKLQFVDLNGQVKNVAIPAHHIDKILDNDIMLYILALTMVYNKNLSFNLLNSKNGVNVTIPIIIIIF